MASFDVLDGRATMTTVAVTRTVRSGTVRQDDQASRARMLSIEDVADYLGVSQRWVYEQVRSGRLPAMLIARSWRLRQEAVDLFAESFRPDPSRILDP